MERAADDGAAGPVNVALLINACSRPAGERHIHAQPAPTHTQAVGIPAGRFTGAPVATGGGVASGESIQGVVRGLQPHQPDSLVNNIANPCVGVGLDSAICNGVSNVVSGPGITDAAGRDVILANSVTPATQTIVPNESNDMALGFHQIAQAGEPFPFSAHFATGRPAPLHSLGNDSAIDVHVPPALKEKIWNGQYVELASLYRDNATRVLAARIPVPN